MGFTSVQWQPQPITEIMFGCVKQLVIMPQLSSEIAVVEATSVFGSQPSVHRKCSILKQTID